VNGPLRIGVLGCGMISDMHFNAWARCKGAKVVAVCDPALDRAKARAEQYGIPVAYASPEQMMVETALDAVDIVTPRETHAAMVRLAARHGLHALCEKPLCPTSDEAVALVGEVGDGVRVMVNENWRYRAYFRKVAEWLQAGRLGTVTQVRLALWRSSMLPRAEDGRIHSLTRQPFLAREERVLIAESLIHEIDVIRALFGEVDVVACCTARTCEAIAGEDTATLLLRTSDGLPITLDGVMTAAGHDVRAPDRLEIAGTRCSIVLDNAVLKLTGAEHETIVYDEAEVRQGCFDASIQHFTDQLRGGGTFWTSAQDQLGSLRVMEDAYRMAGTPRLLGKAPSRISAPPHITGIAA